MPRRTTQRSIAQSVILVIALLLFAAAGVIAVRGLADRPGHDAVDVVGSTVAAVRVVAARS